MDLSPIILRLVRVYAVCFGVSLIGLLGADDWLAAQGPALRTWFYDLPYPVIFSIKNGLFVFYLGFSIVGLWALYRRNRRLTWACLAYGLGQLFFSFLLVRFFKVAIGRPRPCATDMSYWPLSFDNNHNSLPSGHTADAFMAVGVLDRFAGRRWVKMTSLILAVLISLSRVIRFEHYLTDLAVGAIIGYTGSSVAIIYLAKWFGPKKSPKIN